MIGSISNIDNRGTPFTEQWVGDVERLLLEIGDFTLLENDDKILTED